MDRNPVLDFAVKPLQGEKERIEAENESTQAESKGRGPRNSGAASEPH
jgi:hypothetical protein